MSNSRYNYYDPEFNPEEAQGNSLLILITGDTFSFSVIQLESGKVLVWGEQYPIDELVTPASLKQILAADYNSVKIGIQSLSFTIVPDELFEREKLTQYGQFLDKDADDVLLVNKLDAQNYVVFKIDPATAAAVSANFNLDLVYFAGKAWIAGVNFSRPYNQPLYIHIEGDFLQLLYCNEGRLRFYNTFEFSNPDEVMYYTIMVANELGLNLDATSVILSGDISIADRKIHRINDLLPKVYFNQNHVVTLPEGFISHQILMLAGLSLCESLVVN
ncbi:DUF3822 family protein [Mucilaginibacter sp. PPCGB 2223]|uniref:DUF3822 family protein n=1 Tax=Mucilaginibacter sp. PPCGB 2223 TaxID=1886027 RepID=UPI001585FFFD|nr:DUF3822 family protein [Mucilaginibacter sp. PPCGB 2223]